MYRTPSDIDRVISFVERYNIGTIVRLGSNPAVILNVSGRRALVELRTLMVLTLLHM